MPLLVEPFLAQAQLSATEQPTLTAGAILLRPWRPTANAASCRVALKAGFAAEGTRRSAALHADGWHDMHLHARIAP